MIVNARTAHGIGRVPAWLWAVTAIWLFMGVGRIVPSVAAFTGSDLLMVLFFAGKSAIECAAFLWAARRSELGTRLRRALRITAFAYGTSAGAALLYLPALLDLRITIPQLLDSAATFSTYVFGLAGILAMPMTPARRAGWWMFVLDVTTAVIGMATVLTVAVTLPRAVAAPEAVAHLWTYGGAQVLMLIGLNVLVLRGVAWPDRRAFWCFVAGVAGNLVTVAVVQFEAAVPVTAWLPSESMALLTSLCSLWAAYFFRHAPLAAGHRRPGPAWFRSFNPLPMLATGAVAILLLRAAWSLDAPHLGLLAAVMVAQASLLIGRVFLTSFENVRLAREDVERERLVQDEKMAAVGRLAGGMAHWYNNLLAVVIGYAELGAEDAGRGDGAVQQDFAHIRRAATRAAQITDQLLLFSGRQLTSAVPTPMTTLETRLQAWVTPALSSRVTVEMEPGLDQVTVLTDLRQIEAVCRELVTNAVEASAPDGRVRLGLTRMTLAEPIAEAVLPAGPGEYGVIEVADAGCGIDPAVRSSLFDPFFTTKPVHEATGLGLPAVHGIVAAHRGGLTVESEPGRGTTVRVFLPAVTPQ
ncbi:MAG: ATP-binding protein [Vicinamibacterales bacterium]|nr:ATP-binding protein [Vicinamibacterales bacterium]